MPVVLESSTWCGASVAQPSALVVADDLGLASISARATARPEAPLTPAPGQVAAPVSHTPGTAVR
jgi:hypothetical protein